MTAPTDVALTPAEVDTVVLVAAGLTTAQAAARLHVAHDTVKNRLHRAAVRLGAVSRTNLVVRAIAAEAIHVDRDGVPHVGPPVCHRCGMGDSCPAHDPKGPTP